MCVRLIANTLIKHVNLCSTWYFKSTYCARQDTCTCVYCLQSSLYTSSHLYLILVVCFSYQVFLKRHSLSLNTISPHGLTMVSQSMPHPFLPFIVESKKNTVRQKDLWWFTAGTCSYNVGILIHYIASNMSTSQLAIYIDLLMIILQGMRIT